MIGKPEWFTYRIFGWGLRPKTWQGWAYIAVFIALFFAVTKLSLSETTRTVFFAVIFGVLIIDILHLMTQLHKVHDERERYHQLIIERNCSFAAIAAIVGIALFQTYQNQGVPVSGPFPFDTSLMIVLGAMVVIKIVSNVYVRYKG